MKPAQIILLLSLSVTIGKEVKPIQLNLSGPAGHKTLEMSGLTWAGETLLLMPQYPNNTKPLVYGIDKPILKDRIKNPHIPIEPKEYSIQLKNLLDLVPGFQGFEAVCYVRGELFFLIEAEVDRVMSSYLTVGTLDDVHKRIIIDTSHLEKIETPVNIHNMAFESLLYTRKSLWALFEANGKDANPSPKVYTFTLGLYPKNQVSFPNVEYRITDFTTVDKYGRFWAINYFWPGHRKHINPENDIYAHEFGKGKTHQKYDHVERLLEFQISDNVVVPTGARPIEIVLEENNPRNWEGLVKLDELGFLIISDEHPKTIFAFIPYPLK